MREQVLGSDSGRVSVLEFNKERNQFERVHLETFGKSGCRRIVPGQVLLFSNSRFPSNAIFLSHALARSSSLPLSSALLCHFAFIFLSRRLFLSWLTYDALCSSSVRGVDS